MSLGRRQYPFHLIEPKWQKTWDEQQAFRAFNPGDSVPEGHPFGKRHGLSGKVAVTQLPPKFYILDMFPYPSGAGLHVGHPEGYTATDILARYRRACGFNVLHPMGWDSFGLPAEQYAVKTGQHPRVTTEANIANFTRQIKSLGFSYDWSRELATTDPDYFKWTQWIFLKLYNSYFDWEWKKATPIELLEDALSDSLKRKSEWKDNPFLAGTHDGYVGADKEGRAEARRRLIEKSRLAYVSEAPVNWCPELGTVLANEEVIDGKSEVGGFPVIRKPMRQWMLRITAYAEKLLADLDTIDWSDSLKEMQRNWIGRSEGAEVDFAIAEPPSAIGHRPSAIGDSKIRVFTTRPDTLFGATYMVLAPEHKLVDQIILASWPDGISPAWIQGVPTAKTGPATATEDIATKAAHFGAEVVELSKLKIIPEVLALVHGDMARRHRVIPVAATPATATIALADPSDLATIDTLAFLLKRDLNIVVATPSDIEAALQKHYRQSPKEAVADYRAYAAGKSDLERTELAKEKTGVFTGAYAINPVNGEKIPIWIADYVLASYGTGAIMAVPAHDERDWEFVKTYKRKLEAIAPKDENGEPDELWVSERELKIKIVVLPKGNTFDGPFCDDGIAIASPPNHFAHGKPGFTPPDINGLPTAEAKKKITAWLEAKGLGKKTINYKLRDWLFSRQRYWGEPFPIIWKKDTAGNLYHEALPESSLPLLPPSLEDYKPTPDGQPPLARAKDWVNLPDGSTRETNTMPQWAGSCWYYLRYLDAKNAQSFVGKEAESYWMGASGCKLKVEGCKLDAAATEPATFNHQPATPGVDLYVGGTEHAVLHLLYARFWHKVLFDLGYASTPEPFFKLVNQGLILGEDGQKMSKSRGNVVNPDDILAEFGADAFRLYEKFMGPLQDTKPWNTKGVEGVYRFLGRVWRLFVDEQSETEFEQAETTGDASKQGDLLNLIKLHPAIKNAQPTPAQLKTLHACIKKVTEDLDGMRFNTAISAMMVFVNDAMTWETKPVSAMRTFLQLLQPFAPHLAEELWSKLDSFFIIQHLSLAYSPWPKFDPALLVESEIEIPVQVNGKLRDVIKVSVTATNAELETLALNSKKVQQFSTGKTVKKVIVVPKKLVNIVTG